MYKAMTTFGKKLVALRNKAISKGMTLMTEEEINDLDLWQRLEKSEDEKNEEWKKMTNFQTRIGEWGNATFPNGTPASVVAHLKKEVNELAESHDPEEAADCMILLLHHAHRCGYDLMTEADKKFEINKKRRWGLPDKEGIVEHIREENRR
jgi:hypothetical protein